MFLFALQQSDQGVVLMFVCFVKCKEQWYIKLTLLDVFNGADEPVSVSMHPIASEASGVTQFRSHMI